MSTPVSEGPHHSQDALKDEAEQLVRVYALLEIYLAAVEQERVEHG